MADTTWRTGPPPRQATPAGYLPVERGEQLVLWNREQWIYGWRAWSGVYTVEGDRSVHAEGGRIDVIDLVSDEDWWRSELLGTAPSRVHRAPAPFVWLRP